MSIFYSLAHGEKIRICQKGYPVFIYKVYPACEIGRVDSRGWQAARGLPHPGWPGSALQGQL